MDAKETNYFTNAIMIVKIVQGELIMLPDLTGCHWRHTRCYWLYPSSLTQTAWITLGIGLD